LDFGLRYFTVAWAPGGPEALSAWCSSAVSEIIDEVLFATPKVQAVQDSWMGLVPDAQLKCDFLC